MTDIILDEVQSIIDDAGVENPDNLRAVLQALVEERAILLMELQEAHTKLAERGLA